MVFKSFSQLVNGLGGNTFYQSVHSISQSVNWSVIQFYKSMGELVNDGQHGY